MSTLEWTTEIAPDEAHFYYVNENFEAPQLIETLVIFGTMQIILGLIVTMTMLLWILLVGWPSLFVVGLAIICIEFICIVCMFIKWVLHHWYTRRYAKMAKLVKGAMYFRCAEKTHVFGFETKYIRFPKDGNGHIGLGCPYPFE